MKKRVIKKKGMSAVVGYTLLVGMAVAIGAVVIVWSRGAAESQVETILVPYANQADCLGVNANVNFSFGASGDGNYEGCQVRIYNSGNLKWDRLELAFTGHFTALGSAYNEPFEGPDIDVLPGDWSVVSLTGSGLDSALKVQVRPIIKSDGGQDAKCVIDRVFDSANAFSCA